MKENKIELRTLGFFDALTLLFIAFKLTGVIAWSWLWVLAPVWLPAAIIIIIVFFRRDSEQGLRHGPGPGYESLRPSAWRPAVPAAQISANFNGRGPRRPRNGIACTAEAAEKSCQS